jgi:hypothetical protein
MATEHVTYDINGTPDGPCYLKAILVTYFVETIATNFVLRQNLQALPDAIKCHKYNVGTFNSYINELIGNLAQGGEVTTDMMVNLFAAYELVKDHSFHTYISHKKEAYEDGTSQLTPDALMNLALTKYNLLTTQTSWMKKSLEEEQLVALSAQLKQAKAKIDGLSHASTSDPRWTGKSKWKKNYEPWHFENPDGLATMVKDGKTWHWCKWHKCWGTHLEPECRVKQQHDKKLAASKAVDDKAHAPPRKAKKDKKSKDKALSLAEALVAMTQSVDEQESISDSDSSSRFGLGRSDKRFSFLPHRPHLLSFLQSDCNLPWEILGGWHVIITLVCLLFVFRNEASAFAARFTCHKQCFHLSIGRKPTQGEEHTVIQTARELPWSGTTRFEPFR